MAGALRLLLRQVGGGEQLAGELVGRADIENAGVGLLLDGGDDIGQAGVLIGLAAAIHFVGRHAEPATQLQLSLILGVAFGSLGRDVEELIESNPDIAEVFRRTSGGATIVDA